MPDKTYFQKPKDLESLVNTSNLIQTVLPKQADIDKILKIIQHKVFKRFTFIGDDKRNSGRIFKQFVF